MRLDYDVIQGADAGEGLEVFIQTVNTYLSDGWELEGGISVDYEPIVGVMEYQQAVYHSSSKAHQLN